MFLDLAASWHILPCFGPGQAYQKIEFHQIIPVFWLISILDESESLSCIDAYLPLVCKHKVWQNQFYMKVKNFLAWMLTCFIVQAHSMAKSLLDQTDK